MLATCGIIFSDSGESAELDDRTTVRILGSEQLFERTCVRIQKSGDYSYIWNAARGGREESHTRRPNTYIKNAYRIPLPYRLARIIGAPMRVGSGAST